MMKTSKQTLLNSKSCQPTCDEKFPILREKNINKRLFEFYLQYQPKELVDFMKDFDFQYFDATYDAITLLIDMFFDSRDVYFQHKFDFGKTHQNFHTTLKPNVQLNRQRLSKPLHLGKIFQNY